MEALQKQNNETKHHKEKKIIITNFMPSRLGNYVIPKPYQPRIQYELSRFYQH
jgi:hypothetical protein